MHTFYLWIYLWGAWWSILMGKMRAYAWRLEGEISDVQGFTATLFVAIHITHHSKCTFQSKYFSKGQLISKRPFNVVFWTKIPTIFLRISALASKEIKSKKFLIGYVRARGCVQFIYSAKILRNLHLTFDYSTYSQKLGEDFTKFCGFLRIYELY